MTPPEVWKAIPCLKYYEASSLGRIRSLDRLVEYSQEIKNQHMSCSMNVTKKRFFKGKILKLQYYPEKNPYIFFKASGDEAGKQITMTVHRAVCLAFNGLPNNEKNEVGHLDGTKTNNVPENLIWCSSIENNHHKKGHGTLINGINCHNAILSDDDVRSILKLYDAGFKKSQLAKLFGVSRASIRNVINRKTWHHVSIIEKAKGK